MKVINHTIHQFWLLRFDEIPLARLVQQKTLGQFAANFEFSNIQVNEDNHFITAMTGVYRDEFGEHPIDRLVVEERRILLDMSDVSRSANQTYNKIREFLTNLAGRTDNDFLSPIVKSEESEVVAKLEFLPEELISSPLSGFINNKLLPAVNNDFAKANIVPSRVVFLIQYKAEETILDDYRIGLSRKEFIIGPRPGYPIQERMYYSKAPVDTDSHINLLRELEEMLR